MTKKNSPEKNFFPRFWPPLSLCCSLREIQFWRNLLLSGSSVSETIVVLEDCLSRLKKGDLAARDEMIGRASRRLVALARRMLRDYPRVGRWEEPEDLYQRASIRLHRSLADVVPPTVEDFLRFAAAQLRRELKDLAKHYHGPEGLGANYATPAPRRERADEVMFDAATQDSGCSPQRLALWTEFHSGIDQLPEVEKLVFDLLWYHELTQAEAAKVINVPERQLRRIWQSARLNLQRQLGESCEMF